MPLAGSQDPISSNVNIVNHSLDHNIYVPNLNYKCFSIIDKDTIRAYLTTPTTGTITYDDYYLNSHYLVKRGSQTFSNYNTYTIYCINSSNLTNDFYYRNDLSDILIVFFIIVIFCIYLPFSIFGRFCKRLWK